MRTPRGVRTLELEEFEDLVRKGGILGSTLVRLPVVTGDAWVPARELEIFRRLHAPDQIRFYRSFSFGQFPVLTACSCLLLVVLFLWMGGGRSRGLDTLVAWGAKVPSLVVEQGQTWRLLTANLLHRDWLHLSLNVFFLFNMGGPVENTFRRRDFALILVISGLSTTGLSLLFSEKPSVGASGVVLGLFGSASVFGYRFAGILPKPYRRYFGAGVFPYALFIVYSGFINPDTDNWGHIGGFLGGALTTIWLTPGLLFHERTGFWARYGSITSASALLTLVLSSGLWRPSLVRWSTHTEQGLQVQRPSRWRAAVNYLGDPAFGNELGVGLSVRALEPADQPYRVEELRDRFWREVQDLEAAGEVSLIEPRAERPILLEGGRALALEFEVDTRAGRQQTFNLLIEQGYFAYFVVWSSPTHWSERYRGFRSRVLEQLRLVETEALARSRRLVRVFPSMSSARVELGRQLASVGRAEEASLEFQAALDELGFVPSATYELAKLQHDFGGDIESAERAMTELWEWRPTLAYGLLLSDLRRKLGYRRQACEPLFGTMSRSEPQVQARYRALRCSVLR